MTPESDQSACLSRPPRPSPGLHISFTTFSLLAFGCVTIAVWQMVGGAPINIAVSLLWIAAAMVHFIMLYFGVIRARPLAAEIAGNLLMAAASVSLVAMFISSMTHDRRGAPWVEQAAAVGLLCHGMFTLFLFAFATQVNDWAKGLRAYERVKPHCHQCQYDLRGSLAAGSASCPECGEPIRDEKVNAHAAAMIAHTGEPS